MSDNEFDYSEYKPSDYEKLRYLFNGNSLIDFHYFDNYVSFSDSDNSIRISVDGGNEYHMAQDLLDKYFNVPSGKDEDDEMPESYAQLLAHFKSKFDIDTKEFDYYKSEYYSNHPEMSAEGLLKVLSCANIRLKLGEGILDFIYADFKSEYQKTYRFYDLLGGISEELYPAPPTTEMVSEKVLDYDHQKALDFNAYTETVSYIYEMMPKSLYSQIFPPIFHGKERLKSLKYYMIYLQKLQEMYLEMIEFCFDKNFYPEVLGNLCPHERY